MTEAGDMTVDEEGMPEEGETLEDMDPEAKHIKDMVEGIEGEDNKEADTHNLQWECRLPLIWA